MRLSVTTFWSLRCLAESSESTFFITTATLVRSLNFTSLSLFAMIAIRHGFTVVCAAALLRGAALAPLASGSVHFTRSCLARGGWHDVAGAITINGTHHVFQGCPNAGGWRYVPLFLLALFTSNVRFCFERAVTVFPQT